MPKDNAVEPEKTEDITQEKAGPAVAPDKDRSKMTQQEKNIPHNNDPGHTA